ncbi:trans-1,2-dihydrobenzene-1,2-diol dehydrogenase [Pangshura tecta]
MATRWGICSAGKISHDFLVALKTLPATEHQAVAIAARDLSRAQDYARKQGIPRAYGSYEELARDPNVDVVYVGVIHPEHLPVGRLFLGAGKPVLLEKPLGMNAAEVRELAQLARSRGVFLMEVSDPPPPSPAAAQRPPAPPWAIGARSRVAPKLGEQLPPPGE